MAFILALAVVMARYDSRVDAIESSGATEEAKVMPQLVEDGSGSDNDGKETASSYMYKQCNNE